MRETQILSPGWEDLLEKEMATHSSILAWKIPWMEEPSRLQSVGSQRVRHDSVRIRSDQISRSVVSDSLRPHESQHASPPCPSPTPGVHWDSRELCLPWNYLSTLKTTVKKFAILTIFKCFSGVKLTHVCLQGSSFAELFLQNFFILQNWNSVPIKQLLLSSSFQPLATTILRCFHEFDLIRSLIQHLSLCDFYFS